MFSLLNQKRKIVPLDGTAHLSSKLESNKETEFSDPSCFPRESESVAVDNQNISPETSPNYSLNETHQNDSSVISGAGAIEMKELHSNIPKQEINGKIPAVKDLEKSSKVNTDERLVVGEDEVKTQDVSCEGNVLPGSFQGQRRGAVRDGEDIQQVPNRGNQIAGGSKEKVDQHGAKTQRYESRPLIVREGCVPMELAIGGVMLGSVVLAKDGQIEIEIKASKSGSDLESESSNQEESDEDASDDYGEIVDDQVVEGEIEESIALCWIVLAEDELHNEMKKQAYYWKDAHNGGASDGEEGNGNLEQHGNNIVGNDDEGLGGNKVDDEKNKDHAIVEIDKPDNDVPFVYAETNEMGSSGPSRYLRRYYDMMYYFRICAYKPLNTTTAEKRSSRALSFFLQVAFWSLAIISGFQQMCLIKTSFLELCSVGGYAKSAAFAYDLAWFLAAAYAVYIFSHKKAKTQKMLESMMNYERVYHNDENNTGDNNRNTWKLRLINVVAIFAMLLAILRALFVTGIFDFKELLLSSSIELAQNLFVWSSKSMNITSDQLKADYGTNLTPVTITMGWIVIARDAVCYLQMGMMNDLVVMLAVTLYIYVHAFMKEVKAVTGNAIPENNDERIRLQPGREAAWEKYRMLKPVVKAINDTFDPLFKLMHVGNLLLHAFFLTTIMYDDSPWFAILLMSVNLIKAQVFYIVAVKIAEQNDVIRTWIRNWAFGSGKIRVGRTEFDAGLILDEMDKQPIGLGKGKFFIHETFHCKLLLLVGSVFFSMTEED